MDAFCVGICSSLLNLLLRNFRLSRMSNFALCKHNFRRASILMLQLLLTYYNLLFLIRLLLLFHCCRLIAASIVSNLIVTLVTSTDPIRHHMYSVILPLFMPAKIVPSSWITCLRSHRLLILRLGVIFLVLVMLRESFLVGL